jgi:DNA primase
LGRKDIDLDTAEGRTRALEQAIPIVARIRDMSLRDDYARQLAGWVGVPEPLEVVTRVRNFREAPGRTATTDAVPQEARPAHARPDPRDPSLVMERGALQVVLQAPSLAAAESFDELDAAVFTAPAYRAVRDAAVAAGGVGSAAAGGAGWVARVEQCAADDDVRRLVRELAVEPMPSDEAAQQRYAAEVLARLEELAVTRTIADVKSRLQRINPVDQTTEYNRLFAELISLEAHRRELRDRAIGTL